MSKTLYYFIILMCVSLLLVCNFAQTWYNFDSTKIKSFPLHSSSHTWSGSNNTKEVFAVIGADLNPTYLFPLPITVKAWKRLGAGTIICLVGSREEYEGNEAASIVLELLQEEKARLIFLTSSLAPSHTIAQTCRLFAAASPDIDLPNESILITSDSDLWQFHLNIPTGDQMMFLYNSMCCGLTSKPNSTRLFRMYPMGTIAMSAHLWREIMGVAKGWLVDGDSLVKRLYTEFGETFIRNGTGKPNMSDSWYADQILASERIDDWMKTRDDSSVVGQITSIKLTQRLDRSYWKRPEPDFELSQFRDAHILHPLHSGANWRRTLFLLKKMFDAQTVEELESYHEQFVSRLE